MNWAHLRAFAWLRWRLMANQWRRHGSFNAALMVIVGVGILASVIPMFLGALIGGIYLIPRVPPEALMYAWDGVLFFFLLFWAVGILTELQRNDPLSLSRFLHLPVSVRGAFLINYFSSFFRLSLVMFGPMMSGFTLALLVAQGFKQASAPFLLVGFLLMVTALTYQFQGWLASMISNPRRRRAVVVGTTMAIVLIFQVPNLVNVYFTPQMVKRKTEKSAARAAERSKLEQAIAGKKIDSEEFRKRRKDLEDRFRLDEAHESREEMRSIQRMVRTINVVLPPCWPALGAVSSAEGNLATGWLGAAGMSVIGGISLWGAFRSTLAQYRGHATNRKATAITPAQRKTPTASPQSLLVEARIPKFSEPVQAVALAGFRSLLRAPEAKFALLMPLIMGAVFGSILLQGRQGVPELVRPLFGFAGIAFTLFGLLQMMGNQFGIDRDGFRAFVLCSAPRRDILLGKNLCFLPVAFLISALMFAGVQVACPMRIDHALSMLPQFISMYLLFCAMANLFSIASPYYLASGTLKAATPKLSTILLQMLMFMILFPICQGVTLLPLAVEAGLHTYGMGNGVPVSLLLSSAGCVVVVVFYVASLGWLGDWLQAREQAILEIVTNRAT